MFCNHSTKSYEKGDTVILKKTPEILFRCQIFISVYTGAEYQPFEYRKHLNTKRFEVGILNGVVFKWSVWGYISTKIKLYILIFMQFS